MPLVPRALGACDPPAIYPPGATPGMPPLALRGKPFCPGVAQVNKGSNWCRLSDGPYIFSCLGENNMSHVMSVQPSTNMPTQIAHN
jgi:hypothetical protein